MRKTRTVGDLLDALEVVADAVLRLEKLGFGVALVHLMFRSGRRVFDLPITPPGIPSDELASGLRELYGDLDRLIQNAESVQMFYRKIGVGSGTGDSYVH